MFLVICQLSGSRRRSSSYLIDSRTGAVTVKYYEISHQIQMCWQFVIWDVTLTLQDCLLCSDLQLFALILISLFGTFPKKSSVLIFLKEGTWNQNAGVYKTKTTCFVCLEDSSHSLLWTTYRSEKHKYDHPHHDIEGRFVKLWSEPPACQPEGQHEWPFSASLLCKHQI